MKRMRRAAYYVWTDMQLFNCLNLKLNQHKHIAGDLYVLNLERITQPLLEAVRNSGAFEHVVRIMPITGTAAFAHATTFLEKIYTRLGLRRYYIGAFREAVNDRFYDRLVLAGFWADGAMLATVLLANNPLLRIDYIEEGLRHGQEVFAYTLQSTLFSRLMRWFYDGWTIKKWKKRSDYGYFYRPDRFFGEPFSNYAYRSLRPIGAGNDRVLQIALLAQHNAAVTALYASKRVILLEPGDEFIWRLCTHTPTYDFSDLASKIAQIVGPDKVLIHRHPSRTNAKKLAGLIYDDTSFPIELQLLMLKYSRPEQLCDMTLVCYHSSSMVNVISMFDFSIRVIALYKLSERFRREGRFYCDEMVNQLKASLKDPQQIQIPQTADAFFKSLQKEEMFQ